MCKQYWADGATKNCVWLFQVKEKTYSEDGCTCGAFDDEGQPINEKECTCAIESWRTEAVFLIRGEALKHGESRPQAWGDYENGWRIWGVPCKGMMAEILGKHNKEFETKVEYIS